MLSKESETPSKGELEPPSGAHRDGMAESEHGCAVAPCLDPLGGFFVGGCGGVVGGVGLGVGIGMGVSIYEKEREREGE